MGLKLRRETGRLLLGLITFLLATPTLAADRAQQWYRLCLSCHGANGEGKQEIEAPAIAGLPAWYVERQLKNFRDGVRGWHPSDLPGLRMRPMARTIKADEDIQIISEYVAAMPPVETAETVKGNLVNGEAKYAVCTACHQADGSGNKDLNAPTFRGSSDWYLLKQLQNFKTGIRGNPTRDAIGAAMGPMAATLNDQDMKDVVAYINVLKRAQKSE